jgi:hypothetical protein
MIKAGGETGIHHLSSMQKMDSTIFQTREQQQKIHTHIHDEKHYSCTVPPSSSYSLSSSPLQPRIRT